MIAKHDGITHRVDGVIEYDLEVGNMTVCCSPTTPCPYHGKSLAWTIVTFCGLQLTIRGRNKEGHATCLTCLAHAA